MERKIHWKGKIDNLQLIGMYDDTTKQYGRLRLSVDTKENTSIHE